ncbi:MAG: SurA N-terminal domain-containing protein [Actinomycetales bacterium]|nr:SurA N-terminal domain-containing protein [Actinomycetales bacterium]
MRGIGILVAATLLLAGCAGQSGAIAAGAAATVGDMRISQEDLNSQVTAVLIAQQRPVDSQDAALTGEVLSFLITNDLVDRLAQREGVTVTQGEIDLVLLGYDGDVGGRSEVERIFAERNVAPSQIEAFVKTNLLAKRLSQVIAPGVKADEQNAVLIASLAQISDSVGTQVSPRYGTWDAQRLSVGPIPDDLSVPAP